MNFSLWFFPISLVILALSLGVLLGQTSTYRAPTALSHVSTRTPAVATSTKATPKTTAAIATSTASSSPKKALANAVVKKVTTTHVQAPAPTTITFTQGQLDVAAAVLRPALVNILCLSPGRAGSISGSGVIVDAKGVVLTNAHVAQYFMLATDPALSVRCSIRTGSPATASYTGSLMFLPPIWVKDNSDVITTTNPTGTGEHDYAFVAITGSDTNAPLPASFPSVALENSFTLADEPVVIGSYGAQFLTSEQIKNDLYQTIVFGAVRELYTFAKTTPDVVSLGGSAAAQEGSSGGGVIDPFGKLLGIIVTSTIEGDTSTRNLSAITATYISRDFLDSSGMELATFLSKSPSDDTAAYADSIPALRSLIEAQLK